MKLNKFKLFVVFSILIFCVIMFFSSSFFIISNVNITGNLRISPEYIKTACGLNSSSNIFAFSSSGAKKNLLKNQYIADVKISKIYPKTLSIKVNERKLSGYVEYMQNKYLYIDEDGRVLEVASYFTEKLPVVVGLDFKEFSIGEVLQVTNKNAFESVVVFAKIFNKYELESEVIRIDVSDSDNIRFYIYNVDVNIGDVKDLDQKVRSVVAALESYPAAKEAKASLVVDNINTYRLVFLT